MAWQWTTPGSARPCAPAGAAPWRREVHTTHAAAHASLPSLFSPVHPAHRPFWSSRGRRENVGRRSERRLCAVIPAHSAAPPLARRRAPSRASSLFPPQRRPPLRQRLPPPVCHRHRRRCHPRPLHPSSAPSVRSLPCPLPRPPCPPTPGTRQNGRLCGVGLCLYPRPRVGPPRLRRRRRAGDARRGGGRRRCHRRRRRPHHGRRLVAGQVRWHGRGGAGGPPRAPSIVDERLPARLPRQLGAQERALPCGGRPRGGRRAGGVPRRHPRSGQPRAGHGGPRQCGRRGHRRRRNDGRGAGADRRGGGRVHGTVGAVPVQGDGGAVWSGMSFGSRGCGGGQTKLCGGGGVRRFSGQQSILLRLSRLGMGTVSCLDF